MKIASSGETYSKRAISTVLLLALACAVGAQTSVVGYYEICNDSPTTGVPQLRGACALDLSDTEILAANQLTGTITIHQLGDPTALDAIILVPTMGPPYHNGPRGVVFYQGARDGRPDSVIICTYDGLLCTWNARAQAKLQAVIQVNHFALGARYVALDIGGGTPVKPNIYVANEGAGQIEQYTHSWRPVRSFRDPGLSRGFVPHALFVSGDRVYAGWGYVGGDSSQFPQSYVSVFDLTGQLLRRFPLGIFQSFFPLGMAITPPHFGDRSQVLAVCEATRVTFWDPNTGTFLGPLREQGPDSPPMFLDGITNLKSDGDSRLYFTKSVQSEADGVIGFLQVQP
ncbi:MAG TPA: hypothetical protein VJA21_34420 [Verrucomicrobiae bacterium]